MSINVEQTALMEFLKSKEVKYFSKAKELRDEVEKWLSYTPQTFPHYTRHTVHHSDEIILQASKFLFIDEDPIKPVVALTPVEAYILIASAYLHDSGMVSSDKEKVNILSSDEWKRWTSESGGGAKRWQEIQELRDGQGPPDEMIRYFLADLQTRFLVAEFIRRAHHWRAADVVQQHQALLGRFAFDDRRLERTIADVCVAHGLRQSELEDNELYPERRDILGQTVNVRFLAIALRLGDLLDMSYDRACPLLLNAACPLPADSLAHWTQYQRITHFLTATDKIEITAECNTQEEHRVLQDWCQWIVDEVRNAKVLMARATRHKDWALPNVVIDGDQQTIKIRKSADANYIPSKWMIELDQEAIFKRLIYDVYDSPTVFIRELIQNALDANRCQMYYDLQKNGLPTPETPTQVAEEIRARYPLKINLIDVERPNALSGEMEKRQILAIDDSGIGMDREVIERYFLQVGRSFYTTDEFRRSFQFVPTSRFGIGFLSVFAVSDHVVVETYKPSSLNPCGSIRLTLTGPRTYLLTEVGQRRSSGTRIEVMLQESMAQGQLTSLVSNLCRRVEFPILVNDLGSEVMVASERIDSFIYEIPDVTDECARLAVRAFPVNRSGIEGELYVFARVDDNGESWAAWDWAKYTYPSKTPEAYAPDFPGTLICFHGISTSGGHHVSGPMGMRIDYRGDAYSPTMSRENARTRRAIRHGIDPKIESRWEELLREHLATSRRATGEDGWKYKQRLVKYFSLDSFWFSLPETIRVFKDGDAQLVSLGQVQDMQVITTFMLPKTELSMFLKADRDARKQIYIPTSKITSITEADLSCLSDKHLVGIFDNRSVDDVRWEENGYLAINWKLYSENPMRFYGGSKKPMNVVPLPTNSDIIGCVIHKAADSIYEHVLLNANNPLINWLTSVKECCEQGKYGLQNEQFTKLAELLYGFVKYYGHSEALITYLDGWRRLTDIPPNLSPPEIELTRNMVLLTPPH
jgi:molecular chaperone HtpG